MTVILKLILVLAVGCACILVMSGVKVKHWPLALLAAAVSVAAHFLIVWIGGDLLVSLIIWIFS